MHVHKDCQWRRNWYTPMILTFVLFLWSKTKLNQIISVSIFRFSLSLCFCLLCFVLCFIYHNVSFLWYINTHGIWVNRIQLWQYLIRFGFVLLSVVGRIYGRGQSDSEQTWKVDDMHHPWAFPFPFDRLLSLPTALTCCAMLEGQNLCFLCTPVSNSSHGISV